ncbi:MAG: hypothetical protein Q3999_05885 [Buchananella hordeovulneris]|nr:hypothetical protein [Buchananella hordeovulneris]
MAVVLVFVLGVSVVANVHLERKRLYTLADQAASHAVLSALHRPGLAEAGKANEELSVDLERAKTAAEEYVSANARSLVGQSNVRVVDVQVVGGGAVLVQLESSLALPGIQGAPSWLAGNVTILASSGARTAGR